MTVARRKLSPLDDRLYPYVYKNNKNNKNSNTKKKKSNLCRLILLVIAFFQAFLLLLASQIVDDQLKFHKEDMHTSMHTRTRSRQQQQQSLDAHVHEHVHEQVHVLPPLDNYYARSHIQNKEEAEAVPLVVGGSDGSGTRAVADALQQLGVPMVYDDPQTLDVHATQLFHGKGWPPLAELVLPLDTNVTFTVDVDVDASLPRKHVWIRTKLELNRLQKDLEHRGSSLRRTAVRESLKPSTTVSYGFKAPITMLLLPLIQAYMYPSNKFKFLHVVRDGRDVALSDNQSPTQKFYKMTYPHAKQEDRLTKFWNVAPVFGMQLWNDWNVHVLQWEQAQDDTNFDYLVVRTEDLIHDRFETLKKLADFVGSTKTLQELCCLTSTSSRDLGDSNSDLRKTYRQQLRAKKKALAQSRKERNYSSNTTTTTAEAAAAAAAEQEEQDYQEERENHRRLSDSPMVRNPRARRAKRHILDDAPTTTTTRTVTWYQRCSSNMGMMWYYPWFFFFGFGDFTSLAKMQLKALQRKQHASSTTVKERYGKWESLLASSPLLSQALHEQGAEALELFGYNPPRPFSDAPLDDSDFVCDATVKCPSKEKD